MPSGAFWSPEPETCNSTNIDLPVHDPLQRGSYRKLAFYPDILDPSLKNARTQEENEAFVYSEIAIVRSPPFAFCMKSTPLGPPKLDRSRRR